MAVYKNEKVPKFLDGIRNKFSDTEQEDLYKLYGPKIIESPKQYVDEINEKLESTKNSVDKLNRYADLFEQEYTTGENNE